MTALKPCPFCGAKMETSESIAHDFGCYNCGVRIGWTFGDLEEKRRRFNRHTSHELHTSPEVVEALRKAHESLGKTANWHGHFCCGTSGHTPDCTDILKSIDLLRAALARIEGVGERTL